MSAARKGQWLAQVERQAARIRQQITAMTAYAQRAGGNEADIQNICAPYYKSLEDLYRDDFQLAHAIDNSDLLLRLEGASVRAHTPRLSLITSVFTSVRRKVGGVAYAISGLAEQAHQNKEVDLEFSAYATGSLYLGFNLPNPKDEEDGAGLLGENDPFYRATKEAIRTIGVISQKVSAGADEAEITKEVPDALVRDTALAAVQGLAPSRKSRYDSVLITGKDLPSPEFAALTPEVRKHLRDWLKKPITGGEIDRFVGVVREIDLDLQRFALRRLVGTEIQEIRCAYTENIIKVPREYVNEEVSVSGRVHRDSQGNPRLLQVESIETKSTSEQQSKMF